MAKDTFIKNNFSDMPPWAKGVIGILIITGIGVVAYKIYKAVHKDEEEKKAKDAVKAFSDDVVSYQKQGLKLSFAASQYSSAANTIATLLNGCDTFNSEIQAIQEVIKVVKNKLDWAFLVKTFGVRSIDNCGIGTGDTSYELTTLLKDQLDQPGVYSINVAGYKDSGATTKTFQILEKYLATKGIVL